MRHLRLIALLSLALTALTCAEEPVRLWMSADGTRTFKGKFVRRDRESVTFALEPKGAEATIPVAKIHPEDIKWLDANHPLPETRTPAADTPRQGGNRQHRNPGGTRKPGNTPKAPGGSVLTQGKPGPAVFDTIALGDAYDTVMRKLKASRMVESTIPEALMGRTGLNGVYRTKQALAGMNACLFFDWDDQRRLKELTIHSEALPLSESPKRLTPGWQKLTTELAATHGQPSLANTRLDLSSIPDGGMAFTHAWKLQPLGSVMLGAAREGSGYQLTVRYSTEGF